MTKRKYDRTTGDIGNILALEHVNVTVPDQTLATLFYVNVLGFTRDPYMDWGPGNVWVNVGRQQFHLPTYKPQVLRGHIGVVVPSLDSLAKRLHRMQKSLAETCFAYIERKRFIDVVCPWGNKLRCYAPGRFGTMQLGIPYVQFDVPENTSAGIARFYEAFMLCPTRCTNGASEVIVGQNQTLRFRELRKPAADYDGHHIAIYVANFSGPHAKLKEQGLITEESDENQYRFQSIIDPKTGQPLFDIEHEVRSVYHPMYERHLINRNSEQSFFAYTKDRDMFVPEAATMK